MKILKIIKGFVTNSSSANYWLEDFDNDSHVEGASSGVLSIASPGNNEPVAKGSKHETNPITAAFIFVIFFSIVITIYLIRKFKKI